MICQPAVMAEPFSPAQFAEVWQPQRPLAGAKTGTKRRMSRDKALGQSYIEANVTDVMRSLVIVDHDGGMADWIAREFLPPSWIAENADGSHNGHLVYALGCPVCLTDCARRPPVNFLARVEHGANTFLQGDSSYAGTFTKNPHHQSHLTLWGPATAVYTLRDLADALRSVGAMPKAGSPRKHVPTSNVGRNVALFDLTRQWAYKFWHRGHTSVAPFEEGIQHYAAEKNLTVIANEFSKGPLSATEVAGIGRSIARWTWRNFSHSSEAQRKRGRKGGRVSGKARRAQRTLLTLDPEVSS